MSDLEQLLKKTGLKGTQFEVNQTIIDLVGLAQWFDGDTVEEIIDLEQFRLTPAQKTDIRDKSTTSGKVKLLLECWKKRDPFGATFKTLLEILLDRDKMDVAKYICEYLKKSLSKTNRPPGTPHSEAATEQPPNTHPPQQPDNCPPQQPPDNHPPQQPPDSHPPQQPPDNRPPQQPPNNLLPQCVTIIGIIVVVVAILAGILMIPSSSESVPCAPRAYPCDHDLILTNFEQLKQDHSMWYSPLVYTHPQGYRFCLGVTPNGEKRGNGTHVTVAVFFMKGEFDYLLKWPFRGNITFELVDQQKGVLHKPHVVSYDDSVPDDHCSRVTGQDRAMWGWGAERFIAHTELKPRYLINDTLKFRITMVDVCGH